MATKCFKTTVMELRDSKTQHFVCAPAGKEFPEPFTLGLFLMTKISPQMESKGETRFAWDFRGWDVVAQTDGHWRATKTQLKKLTCEKGDTVYHYDFKSGDKMRRATLRTEIWYDPETDMPLSPTALLFGQWMGHGYHFVTVEFSDVPAAE